MNHKIDIDKVADMLDINIQTLRRWDERGIFKARRDNPTAHRYYIEDDIENFLSRNYKYLLHLATKWSFSEEAINIPYRFYCENSNIFKVRLSQLGSILQRDPAWKDTFSLITSVLGEIGNNSFDHNLGNWRDIPGIFFGYSLSERKVIIADRGQGVLTTLKRVKADLVDDKQALEVAFTEYITGRSPEHRGNGLKYVKKIIQNNHMDLWFHSGVGALNLRPNEDDLILVDVERFMGGCFIILEY